MDSVLDFLFLRRLKMEYISPPVCPFPIASATGLSIPVQSICPLQCPDAPVDNNGFVIWNIEPLPAGCCTNVVCYNLYEQSGANFIPVSECQKPNSLVVCSAGSWQVSAIFSTGTETALTGPFVSDGINPLTIPLPFAEGVANYRVVKNGVTVLFAFFSAAFEVCATPVCYALSQITSDGETCLSPPVCIEAPPPPPSQLKDGLAHYWKLDEASTGTRADSVDSAPLTDVVNNCPNTPGVINLGADIPTISFNSALQAASGTVGQISPGQSFTISFWARWLVSGFYVGHPFLAKWDIGTTGEYQVVPIFDNTLVWRVKNAVGVLAELHTGYSALANVNNFAHIVIGYDDAAQQLFAQINGTSRLTAPCAGIQFGNHLLTFGNYSDLGTVSSIDLDEIGFWYRALTQAEVSTLYNNGHGYALSNFYP